MKVIYVVILWLLWLQNMCNYVVYSFILASTKTQFLQYCAICPIFFFQLSRILTPLWLFRVFSQHRHSSDGHQSDTAVSRHSHTLTISSTNHAARSGPDQQQQQQERHVHWWSSQTGRRLDKGDCCSSQSITPLPEPDQTAETPAGPGRQSTTHGSSYTWGIRNGEVHSGIDD